MIGTCLCCNTEFKYLPTRQAGKYCSNKCQHDYQALQYIENWINGKETGGSIHKVASPVRRWLLNRANHQCEKCGWCEIHPVTGKPPLEVNHRDGNPLNHTPENLEVLCPNCHSLTPTFRNLNKGNGRSKCPISTVVTAPAL